jgi:hypothetical protein
MCIMMVPELISTAYFINLCQCSMCRPVIARQRLSKNLILAMYTDAKIEELLDASFSMRSISYQGEAIISSQNFLF